MKRRKCSSIKTHDRFINFKTHVVEVIENTNLSEKKKNKILEF